MAEPFNKRALPGCHEENKAIEVTTEGMRDGIESNAKVCDNVGALESEDQVVVDIFDTLVASEKEDIIQRRCVATNKRPKRVKTAKAEKRAKAEGDVENDAFKDAIYSSPDRFEKISSATTTAANVRHGESRIHGEREYQLKKDADELEAVRVLFNDDDDDSMMYRNSLKIKCLRKLLKEQGQSVKASSSPSAGVVPDTLE